MEDSSFIQFLSDNVEIIKNMDMESLRDLFETLKAREKYKLYNKSEFFNPYPYQKRFYELGDKHRYRFLMAGNRCGKTFSQAYESYLHLTGLYPDWWKGRRFNKPINFWFMGISVDQCIDVGQYELLGTKNAKAVDEIGSGSIPKKYIDLGSMIKDGAQIKRIRIKHYNNKGIQDGFSTLTFKTSQADSTAYMGSAVDYVWTDELPPFNDLEIFTQLVARTTADTTELASVCVTGTPEKGFTELVQHFVNQRDEANSSLVYMQAGAMDAHVSKGGHLTDSMIENMLSAYPAYQREMRLNGTPILGDGLVFSYPIRDFVVQPIEIPAHWKRIAAMDIGIGHPTAVTWCAHDPDSDIIYVTDTYQLADGTPETHAISINARGKEIPVVLPHDASQRSKDTGRSMQTAYKSAGVNVLPELFYNAGRTYKGKKSNDIDTGIVEIQSRFQTGQIKIFASCQDLVRGLEQYSQKNGVIDKSSKYDDLIDSFRYSVMSVARRGKAKNENVDKFAAYKPAWKSL